MPTQRGQEQGEAARKPRSHVALVLAGVFVDHRVTMGVRAGVRQWVKVALRPVASPLLWRLRLPFDVMLPRIEILERRIGSMPDSALRETVDNLTRTWLRLENEVARLSSSMPEPA